jgi:hypothetical protein
MNTIIAGLIALLHNGGLPSKYRLAWKAYEDVKFQISEVLETGLVRREWDVDEVVEWCFELYGDARRRVEGGVKGAGKAGVGSFIGGTGFV